MELTPGIGTNIRIEDIRRLKFAERMLPIKNLIRVLKKTVLK